ncbi:hypothetical protein MTO96_023569 [Rhipicephalus appendiculatus]
MRAALFGQTGSFVAALAFTTSLLGQVLKVSAQNQKDASSDIINVTVRSRMGTSITAAWPRPQYSFDHYRVRITVNKLDSNGTSYPHTVGLCTLTDMNERNHNLTDCGDFEGCTHVNVDILAYSPGDA